MKKFQIGLFISPDALKEGVIPINWIDEMQCRSLGIPISKDQDSLAVQTFLFHFDFEKNEGVTQLTDKSTKYLPPDFPILELIQKYREIKSFGPFPKHMPLSFISKLKEGESYQVKSELFEVEFIPRQKMFFGLYDSFEMTALTMLSPDPTIIDQTLRIYNNDEKISELKRQGYSSVVMNAIRDKINSCKQKVENFTQEKKTFKDI